MIITIFRYNIGKSSMYLRGIWKIISKESNLNLYHPFCKNNDIISWNDDIHHDRLEYLNGVILERKFISGLRTRDTISI